MCRRNIIHLFDKVRVRYTGEIDYVVDISKKDYLILERDENDLSEERLIYDLFISDVEVMERHNRQVL